jgi:DNA-binding PadR family transcriptional regulator
MKKENEEIKKMLESSKRMYEAEIRKKENQLSWYRKQIGTIELSLKKLEKNNILEEK